MSQMVGSWINYNEFLIVQAESFTTQKGYMVYDVCEYV